MGKRIVHMQIDVRGAILNWRDRHYRGVCTDPATGRVLSPREAKRALLDALAEGKRLLPIGGPCEGFSYETGCPGHDVEEAGDA